MGLAIIASVGGVSRNLRLYRSFSTSSARRETAAAKYCSCRFTRRYEKYFEPWEMVPAVMRQPQKTPENVVRNGNLSNAPLQPKYFHSFSRSATYHDASRMLEWHLERIWGCYLPKQ